MDDDIATKKRTVICTPNKKLHIRHIRKINKMHLDRGLHTSIWAQRNTYLLILSSCMSFQLSQDNASVLFKTSLIVHRLVPTRVTCRAACSPGPTTKCWQGQATPPALSGTSSRAKFCSHSMATTQTSCPSTWHQVPTQTRLSQGWVIICTAIMHVFI